MTILNLKGMGKMHIGVPLHSNISKLTTASGSMKINRKAYRINILLGLYGNDGQVPDNYEMREVNKDNLQKERNKREALPKRTISRTCRTNKDVQIVHRP